MTAIPFHFTGAEVLLPEGLVPADVRLQDGRIAAVGGAGTGGRRVDLRGWTLCPGIVDIHGDGFERHVAVRRGALASLDEGLVAAAAELAANGITTAMLAQFWSWEGGQRGPDFARRLAAALSEVAPELAADLRLQLRFEMAMVEDYAAVRDLVDLHGIGQVVFNDHLPHAALAAGRTPPRLTGMALRAGRSPEAHLAVMQALHAGAGERPAALAGLAADLAARGVRLGSHDDATPEQRGWFRGLGATLAEFPETRAAAEAARAGGDGIVLGAPNVVRGASHAGNASARDLVAAGLCDALASDYHYPAPRQAVRALVAAGICDFAAGWRLVSEGPARLLGLEDRGRIVPGLRADLAILDRKTGRVGATVAGGRITHLASPLAERFFG